MSEPKDIKEQDTDRNEDFWTEEDLAQLAEICDTTEDGWFIVKPE